MPRARAQANYCIVSSTAHTTLPPSLFDCVSGGLTDGAVTYCLPQPGAGLIAIVVVIPTVLLIAIVTASCFCCRCCPVYKRRHTTMEPPVPFAVQPTVVIGSPVVVTLPAAVAAPCGAEEDKKLSPADV